MNNYQRHLLGEYPVNNNEAYYHSCTKAARGRLPEELHVAAKTGDLSTIQKYLDEESDVNALYGNEDLLSIACEAGQTAVVELLLKEPLVHLNLCFDDDRTPLFRAIEKGHLECVTLILNSQTWCRPNLEKCWPGILKVLQQKAQLNQKSILYILDWATYKAQWEIVCLLLETEHHIPGETLYLIIIHALHQNRWDIIKKIIERNFNGKEEFLNEIFAITVQLRCWERVQEVLQIMDKELKLELSLVEAALDGTVDEVQRLLSKRRYDAQTLNGCLLVVAASGTSEPIAQLLLNFKDTYTHRTFSDALYLASLGEHSALFSPLLCNSEAAYTFHDYCRAHKVLETVTSYTRYPKHESMINFLNRAMESKVKNITS